MGAMSPGASRPTTWRARCCGSGSLTYAGYFFGNIPWIKGNLTLIIVGIIVVSLVPVVWRVDQVAPGVREAA